MPQSATQLGHMLKGEQKRALKAEQRLRDETARADRAERQVRDLTRELQQWRRRAEVAEAGLASLKCG